MHRNKRRNIKIVLIFIKIIAQNGLIFGLNLRLLSWFMKIYQILNDTIEIV